MQLPKKLVATNNFQKWLISVYAEKSGCGSSRKEILAAFYLDGQARADKHNVSFKEIKNAAASFFVLDGPPDKGLSTTMIDRVILLFPEFDLSREMFSRELVERRLFIVLANVSLENGHSMGKFLKEIFDVTAFIESAYAVYGNHDCVFTLYASHDEIQAWLWDTVRNFRGVRDFRSVTYQTYSDSYNRRKPRDHPDHDKITQARERVSTSRIPTNTNK